MLHLVPLLAQHPQRTMFEWGRIQSNTDWILPLAAFAAAVLYVVMLYRRDSVEFGPVRRWCLTGLRIAALAGLLIIYLQPQMRTERDVTTSSRVVMLIDTSLSMGLEDDAAGSSVGATHRLQPLVSELATGRLLDELRARHDVVVTCFDDRITPVITLSKHDAGPSTPENDSSHEANPAIDWPEVLAPRGTETRLGQALRETLIAERTMPLAGIILYTDGGQNAGAHPDVSVQLAAEQQVPLFPIGVGADRQPINVRLADLVAPARAFPGDHYTVTGYVQAYGLGSTAATVELFSRSAATGELAAGDAGLQLEAVREIVLGNDGEATPVKFELLPSEAGRRQLLMRVRAPSADTNPNDNQQTVDIEIVDRKTHVLLLAGGPTREYSFLRTQLHRDEQVTTDVLLQTGQEGMSQEAERILQTFPSAPDEMARYDAIVAFDPDWQQFSSDQLALLERWVSDQAGGLIVVAGPVHTHSWVQNESLKTIRDLYPVEFNRRFSLLDDGRFGATEPWPIEFTREGLEADFLWVEENATASQQAWDSFPGVFGYYAVRGAKPGATVYGHYSDPRGQQAGEQPIYMCGQFYGSGRVFYLGSGELWRLRALDDAYFERFYTKLLRHVAQGRLLRGSTRGVLLAERDRYFLGQNVSLRAQVSNQQLEPLDEPSLSLQVFLPDNSLQSLQLTADPQRLGNYSGQFNARQEGTYRLELPLPDGDNEVLSRRIQVRVPDLERENPLRNDALLSALAQQTGGHYFQGLASALAPTSGEPLTALLPDRSRTLPVSDVPRALWDNIWFLLGICGLLSLEWLIRRLSRLA